MIVDASSTDADVLNLSATADVVATPTVVGIENVNVNFSGFTANGVGAATTLDINAASIGATKLNVTTAGSTAVNALSVTDLADGTEVTASSTFASVTLTADDKASLVVNTSAADATKTSVVSANGAGAGDLNNLTVTESVGKVTVSSDAKGTLTVTSAKDAGVAAAAATAATVTAGGDVTITNLAAAKTVAITSTAGSINTGTLTAATSVNLTATKKVVANLSAATETTISAAGVETATDSTLDSVVTSATLKTANLSGNGAAAEFDMTGANLLATVNVSGTQDVKVKVDIDDVDGLASGFTMTNAGTGATELSVSGALGADADLSKVATATKITFTADMETADAGGNKTIKLANGANIVFDAAQGATVASKTAAFTADSTTAASNAVTFTVDKSGTTTSTYAIGDLTTTNIKTVNLDLSKDTAATTLGTVNVGAANNIAINVGANNLTSVTDITAAKATFTGSGNLTLADLTIGELDASAATGNVTYTIQAGDVARTGSGADEITAGAAMNLYIESGAGNDTVTLTGDNSANTVFVNMGDGNGDTLRIADASNLNGAAVSISGVEKFAFINTTGATEVTVRDTLLNASTAAVFGTASVVDTITIAVSQASNDFSSLAIDTATIATGDTFVINATDYTAAVSIVGTDADDVITGATKSGTAVFQDTLNGGDGNDTLVATQGGDSYIGGAGTDTLNVSALKADNIEGGTSDSSGVIVNLGSTAVSGAAVASAMATSYLSKSLTEVGAGKVGYLFATDATTNSAVVGSAATIENVIGSAGADYIVASSTASKVTGGEGADYIVLGAGSDTVVYTGGTGASAILKATSIGGDKVVGWTSAGDEDIQLSDTLFSFATSDDGAVTLAAAEYGEVADLTTALTGANAAGIRVVTNGSDVDVYYIDGTGGATDTLATQIAAGDAVKLVTLVGVALTGISEADFSVIA